MEKTSRGKGRRTEKRQDTDNTRLDWFKLIFYRNLNKLFLEISDYIWLFLWKTIHDNLRPICGNSRKKDTNLLFFDIEFP